MKSKLTVLTIAAITAGCQTTAREVMPDNMYHEFARIGVGLKYCTINKKFAPYYSKRAIISIEETLKTWSYDKPTLDAEITYIESIVKQEGFPTEACSGIARELNRMISRYPQTVKDNAYLDNLEHQMIWGTPSQWEAISKQADDISQLGNNALNSSTKISVPHVENPVINKSAGMPDYQPKTGINNINTHQILKSTERSDSGKLICYYSAGTVKAMPLGTVSCPSSIN